MTKLARLMAAKELNDRTLAEMVSAPELEIWRLRKGPLNRGQPMTLAWAQRLAPALDIDWSDLLDDEPDTATSEVFAAEKPPAPEPAARAQPGPRPDAGRGDSGRQDLGRQDLGRQDSGRQDSGRVAIYERAQEPLSRDDLRIIHGIVSACALNYAPNVRISPEAFRDLVQRAIENAAYGPDDLAALADRIATWLAPGAADV
ncbi:helix-turn-helix domain-containing protein [Rhodoblastus acidophilus]|nr:hypothetical protein [Rhodoblastus acidophilus]